MSRVSRFAAVEQGGQVIVMVALTVTLLLGFVGIGIDIAWFQLNVNRIQRAADAAALAGVVYLPNQVAQAQAAALAEATKNGYTNGAGGVTVTAAQDPLNPTFLNATVSAPVSSWFARLLGIATFQGARSARAEFILPVPMGSPLNYWGINVICSDGQTPPVCPQVPSADGVGNLAPLGFFGGVETMGAEKNFGDAYSTFYDNRLTPNPQYDASGYSYIVDFGPGTVNGRVWIFDPKFCATGASTADPSQRLGVGDFWLLGYGVPCCSAGLPPTPISVQYELWDVNNSPFNVANQILLASSGGLFLNSFEVDRSAAYGGNGDYGFGYTGGGAGDCTSSPYHMQWWNLASGLGQGQFRIHVTTSVGSTAESAIKSFGIEATVGSGPTPHVYAQTRMVASIIVNGTAVFYMAQIPAVHAGKTLQINLFDPGDIPNSSFRVLIPTAAGYSYATFTWTASGSWCGKPTSGGPTTTIVASGPDCGVAYYEDYWLTIRVPIPMSYTAPTPPGEPGPGWWKIQYATLGSSADITTWSINIEGNPVHLVVP
jgi:hypothetical protein